MARVVQAAASRRPVRRVSAAKRSARTTADQTRPASTSVVKLDPNSRKKLAWKYGVNGPNQ